MLAKKNQLKNLKLIKAYLTNLNIYWNLKLNIALK